MNKRGISLKKIGWVVAVLGLAMGACNPAPAATVAPPDLEAAQAAGVYLAQMPAASSPGIQATLVLNEDQSASLTLDYMNDETPINQTGTWQMASADQVRVNFTDQDGKPITNTIVFTLSGDTLTALEYDQQQWGTAGLTLTRSDG